MEKTNLLRGIARLTPMKLRLQRSKEQDGYLRFTCTSLSLLNTFQYFCNIIFVTYLIATNNMLQLNTKTIPNENKKTGNF